MMNGKYICPDLEYTPWELHKYVSKKHTFVFMHITPFKWTDNGIDCHGTDPDVRCTDQFKRNIPRP